MCKQHVVAAVHVLPVNTLGRCFRCLCVQSHDCMKQNLRFHTECQVGTLTNTCIAVDSSTGSMLINTMIPRAFLWLQDSFWQSYLILLSQWPTFKLLGITYLLGKVSRLNFYFMVRNGLCEFFLWFPISSPSSPSEPSSTSSNKPTQVAARNSDGTNGSWVWHSLFPTSNSTRDEILEERWCIHRFDMLTSVSAPGAP